MTCPLCGDKVSELIEDPRLDAPLCYWCIRDILGLPRKADGE